jgi:MFS family permease
MPLPVFSLMLVVFSLTTGEFVIAGILPDVAADLAVSVPAAGLLVTAYATGMIVGGPTVTVLTARLARKPLIVALVACPYSETWVRRLRPPTRSFWCRGFAPAWSWPRSSPLRSVPPSQWRPRATRPPPSRRWPSA